MSVAPTQKTGRVLPPDGTLARQIHRLKIRARNAVGTVSRSLLLIFVLLPAAIFFGLGLWLKLWKLNESEVCECCYPSPDEQSQLLEACLMEKKAEGQSPGL